MAVAVALLLPFGIATERPPASSVPFRGSASVPGRHRLPGGARRRLQLWIHRRDGADCRVALRPHCPAAAAMGHLGAPRVRFGGVGLAAPATGKVNAKVLPSPVPPSTRI